MTTSALRPVIAGNWKMHKGPTDAAAFCDALRDRLDAGDPPAADVLLFPSAVALAAVAGHPIADVVGVGAQTIHPEPSGAFTGEMSAEMAADAGATWSLAGHSERRHVFGETDDDVAARVGACLRAGLRPMVCVGETLEQRRGGRLESVLRRQLEAVLPVLAGASAPEWAIAYEPVWAIGTGETARPEDAHAAHAWLRSVLEAAGRDVPPILYGGSVKPDNAAELLATDGVDGVLVGGASLDPLSFHAIAGAVPPR